MKEGLGGSFPIECKANIPRFPITEFISSRCKPLQYIWAKSTPEKKSYYVNLAIVGGFLIADMLTTYGFLSRGHEEMNPIMSRVLDQFGEAALYGYRLTSGSIAISVLALELIQKSVGYNRLSMLLRGTNTVYLMANINNIFSAIQ